jgi:hypothetical protein
LTPRGHRGYDPNVPTRLPLTTQRLVVVTGKGGVGKSTVTAALAHAVARAGRRVLAVAVGAGRLGPLLGAERLHSTPATVARGLSAAAIEPEIALGEFLNSVLRFRVLSRRLMESTSFQVLAAAAPGLPEFLVLHRLLGWLDARRVGGPTYDLVVVDAPASGHSLPLLEAPRTLGAMVRFGPVTGILERMAALLGDPAQTLVCPVTRPEELAVRETIELHQALTERLGLPVAPPIVNALPPRRFTAADAAELAALPAGSGAHPHVLAARLVFERRRLADAQVQRLRSALGVTPLSLPFLFAGPEAAEGLAALAADLALAAGIAA